MRLLLTTDTVGGVWDYSVTLARALERDGHALLLAVVGDPSDDQLDQLPEEIAIECRDDRLEWLLASRRELGRTAGWLARLARGWGAEVVHLNQMAYSGLGAFGAPTIVVVHSDAASWFSEVLHAPPPIEWSEYLDVVRTGLHAADYVVAPSVYQGDLVLRHFGRRADAIIHNGVEPPETDPTPRTQPLLLSAGRAWDEAKGMAVFDRAVAILGEAAPPAHLLGSLKGPHGPNFRSTALECHGRVSSAEAEMWMSRATIYVGPSLYEPFGLSPLEAALRGCALVLSDIGSFRELWDGCAAFFTKGSAPSLAHTLQELVGDPGMTTALGQAARQRALSRFTADRFAGEYLELYEAAAAPDRPLRVRSSAALLPGPIGRKLDQENQCS
ncbi:MAG: glycosyltransferase family 4 protein [Gemmatimonadota bacterium]